MSNTAARLGAIGFLFTAAGAVGDMWIQNDDCARIKGAHDDEPIVETDPETGEVLAKYDGHDGRRACVHHVLTYTATQAVAVVAANKLLRLGVRPGPLAAGLAVSAVTHYVADRRRPLKRLAELTGKGRFYGKMAPICGPFELDQAWHRGWEALAAAIAAR